jgi:Acetyltransferases
MHRHGGPASVDPVRPRPRRRGRARHARRGDGGVRALVPSYSTFLAQPGIYLEDLFVFPAHRGQGLGRRLLAHLAATAVERGYGRVEWAVLDWNEDAIRFYRSLGAVPMADWTTYRLTGDALVTLGVGSR